MKRVQVALMWGSSCEPPHLGSEGETREHVRCIIQSDVSQISQCFYSLVPLLEQFAPLTETQTGRLHVGDLWCHNRWANGKVRRQWWSCTVAVELKSLRVSLVSGDNESNASDETPEKFCFSSARSAIWIQLCCVRCPSKCSAAKLISEMQRSGTELIAWTENICC